MSIYTVKLQERQNEMLYEKEGINYVGLFGSAARGEETSNSDVDVLVDFDRPKTLFDLADIQFHLERSLGRKVDLVTRKSLKPQLKPYIERDLITVYEKN